MRERKEGEKKIIEAALEMIKDGLSYETIGKYLKIKVEKLKSLLKNRSPLYII